MGIILYNSQARSTTVSNLFLDHFMPQASGEFVKIYLHLLRCFSEPSKEISINGIADVFNQTETDVMRALRYWEQTGLLSLCMNDEQALSSITLLECKQPTRSGSEEKKQHQPSVKKEEADESNIQENAAKNIPEKEEHSSPIESHLKGYSVQQLTSLFADPDFGQILYIAQRYLGKTFSETETNIVLYIYDKLHFPTDLIEYLIEYCVTNGHKSLRYIEKVAIAWSEKHVASVAEAKALTTGFNQTCFTVMKAFGLSGRSPGDSEISLIQKWMSTYQFPLDIILEACNRTIRAIHQPSFEYADRILTRWHNQKVKTISDVANLDEQYSRNETTAKFLERSVKNSAPKPVQNRFNNMTPRSYVYDDLEKQLLNQ